MKKLWRASKNQILNSNLMQYEKFVKDKYNFKPYPYKHYESIFTRFYQGYILPNKFGIDKRILHLSTLIISKQLKRDEAIKELKSPNAYPSQEMLENDKLYFLQSKPHGGKILGMADYVGLFEKDKSEIVLQFKNIIFHYVLFLYYCFCNYISSSIIFPKKIS